MKCKFKINPSYLLIGYAILGNIIGCTVLLIKTFTNITYPFLFLPLLFLFYNSGFWIGFTIYTVNYLKHHDW